MIYKRVVLAFAIAFCSSGIQANEVIVQHADLQIALPDQPMKDVKKIGGEDGTEPSLQHRLIINKPNGSIIVWYQDAPSIRDADNALQTARDSVVRLARGEVSIDKKVVSQQHPGRYFIVSLPAKNGEFRVAYYLAHGRVYQVMAVGTKDFTRSESSNKMFSSVKFQEPDPADQ